MKKFEKNLERWAKESVPDVLEKVLEQKGMPTPQKTPHARRLGRLVPLLMLPIIAVLALILTPSEDLEASSVYLDFETALEIQVDEDNRIVDLVGENVSGQALVQILKDNPDWENEDLEAYLPQLFRIAKNRGFIQADTPILIGSRAENTLRQARLKAIVINRMQNLSVNEDNFGDIYDLGFKYDDISVSEISPTRVSRVRNVLIRKIIEVDDSYTNDELENLSLRELLTVTRSLDVEINTHPSMQP